VKSIEATRASARRGDPGRRYLAGRVAPAVASGTDVLAAELFALAAVYVGSALADGRRGIVALEASMGAAIFARALAGFWYALRLVAAGYFLHGVWDLLHHPYRCGATPGKLFPPFCLTYDWVVTTFILSRFGSLGQGCDAILPPPRRV